MIKELENRQNYLSVDEKTAMSGNGDFFKIGEKVKHDGAGEEQATIQSFICDKDRNEIRVNTDKGYAHIDFLVKL